MRVARLAVVALLVGVVLVGSLGSRSGSLSDRELRGVLRESNDLAMSHREEEAFLLLQPLASDNAFRVVETRPGARDNLATHLGYLLYMRGDIRAALPYLRFAIEQLGPDPDSFLVPLVRKWDGKPVTAIPTMPGTVVRLNGRPVGGVVAAKGRIFAPAHVVADMLGASVSAERRGWVFRLHGRRVRLLPSLALDSPGEGGAVPARGSGPRIVMVALRPLMEQLGASQRWDSGKRELHIEQPSR